MPYVGLFWGGFLIQPLQFLLVCIKYSSMLVISWLINSLLLLSPVSDPNMHALSGIPFILPLILFKAVDLYFFSSTLYLHFSPSCKKNTWFQKYGLLHHLPFLYPKYVVTVSDGYNRTCSLPRIGVSLRHVDKVPHGKALEHTRPSNSSTAREFSHGKLINTYNNR